jgi:hypothetical protein
MSSIPSRSPDTRGELRAGGLRRVGVGLALLGAGLSALTPRDALCQPREPPVATETPSTDGEAGRRARALHHEGLERFEAGDYTIAAARFREAYELTQAPGFLYNIGQAERLSGRCSEALSAYRRFLATEAGGATRSLAEAHVAELDPCADEAPSTAAPAAREPELPRRDPSGPALRLTAVPVAPLASTRGRTSTQHPFDDSPTPSPQKSRERDTQNLEAALCFGGAVALLSFSGYFAWRADRASDQVSQAFAHGSRWDDAHATLEREGATSETLAVITLGGGILAAGIGAWLLAVD